MTPTEQDIDRAVAILRSGGLVAFPTETVYGLGADASNPQAVHKIFAAKGRPADHPLIVHVADATALSEWVIDIPEAAHRLTKTFWPGPLTLVLKKHPKVNTVVTGGQATIGMRCPSHPVAQGLLRAFGGGIAAPSANRFGRISPTTAAHVREELGDRVDMILDGGQSEVGLESTIIDLSAGTPVLLRPGVITTESIATVLGVSVSAPNAASPRASGMLEVHYAPRTPMFMLTADEIAQRLAAARRPVGVLALHAKPPSQCAAQWITASRDARQYAHDLYASLRALDQAGLDEILVEAVPEHMEWMAIRDRLMRACASRA